MRYYFHLVSETVICIDHIGQELESLREAKAEAARIARERATSEPGARWAVSVVNDDNKEVLRLPVADAALTG